MGEFLLGEVLFYRKYLKDVSREFDEFQVNSLLIFASFVVGTCNILYG